MGEWLEKEHFFYILAKNNQKSALLVSKGETLMVVNLENFLTKHPTWTSGTTKC